MSTATGLPLRRQTAMIENGTTKARHDVRFDDANVRAPAGASR
jgi:hypothetical protein